MQMHTNKLNTAEHTTQQSHYLQLANPHNHDISLKIASERNVFLCTLNLILIPKFNIICKIPCPSCYENYVQQDCIHL